MGEIIGYLLVTVITFVLGIVGTRGVMRAFSEFRSREVKAGKEQVYRHYPRQKKPLGGGIAIFAALTAGVLITWVLDKFRFFGSDLDGYWGSIWLFLFCGLAYGLIGLYDDWRKVNAARGLDERAKIILQLILAFFFTAAIVNLRHTDPQQAISVFIPFGGWVTFYKFLFLPFGMFVLVGMSNAVNLTDGLDGLAGSSLALSFIGYLLLAAVIKSDGIPVVLPLLALAGVSGFLIYNRPPAQIIMGDTGALGLGAALGALALLSRTEWLLILFAAPFVIDTVSVMIQVGVIKFFRGPVKLLRHQTTEIFRPFLCTPLHHHFQWLNWTPWSILGLFCGVSFFSIALGIFAAPAALPGGAVGYGWLWFLGIFLQCSFLLLAALQKIIRANYFLGLEPPPDGGERVLSLYKGLPIIFFGARGYSVEERTVISEGMVNTIAAESILWRNVSEIEARATLGKIYAEYKMTDAAATEWEQIPVRNLLIRENVVVQLGKIYFTRDELLRAIILWEQLPPVHLAHLAGLTDTIRGAKVRIGHLAGRLHQQAQEHIRQLNRRAREHGLPVSSAEITMLQHEVEGALRYNQELRDLLTYEHNKTEGSAEPQTLAIVQATDLYRRMDVTLSTRIDELRQALLWANTVVTPQEVEQISPELAALADDLQMKPLEISRALEATGMLRIKEYARIEKPSRNSLFRITLERKVGRLPSSIIAKCFLDSKVTFFSACYRREFGVLTLLQEALAPSPHLLGGYLGNDHAVLFLEDVAGQDLNTLLRTLKDNRLARQECLRRALESLVQLRVNTFPFQARLEREISRIVKEVLTPEYYLNSTVIAFNRILALEKRTLTGAEKTQLETALQPVIKVLQAEPKIFIHFEYTPGNLQYIGQRTVAIDFEQATMGPAAFDLASLLYAPESNMSEKQINELLVSYHEMLPANLPDGFNVSEATLEAAALIKLFFYAGSAANFYRKFEDGARLEAMEWYLQTAEKILAHYPEYTELARALRTCWTGQRHLAV